MAGIARPPLVTIAGGQQQMPVGDICTGIPAMGIVLPAVGDWFMQPAAGVSNSGVTGNQALLGPLWLPPGTYDQVAFFIGTAGSAGSVVRVALYNDSGNRPGSLLLDCGTVTGTTTGQRTITGLSLTVGNVPLMWGGCISQGAPTTSPSIYFVNSTSFPYGNPNAAPTFGMAATCYAASNVAGAAPNPSGVGTTNPLSGYARLAFHRSA